MDLDYVAGRKCGIWTWGGGLFGCCGAGGGNLECESKGKESGLKVQLMFDGGLYIASDLSFEKTLVQKSIVAEAGLL